MRASREVWAKRVERWKDSGLSAKEFAAELDVSAKTLTFWRWKLRQGESGSGAERAGRRERQPTPANAAPAAFLQLVPASTASPSGTALEVVLRDGIALRVAAHTLKSSSANVGATTLSEAARDLEHGARDGTLTQPANAVARIVGEFAQVRAALQAKLKAEA